MLQLRRASVSIVALMIVTSSAGPAASLCAVVMDYARLPLPSVSLTATGLATGKAYATRTDSKGAGCITDIPEGLYSIEASLAGFLHVKYFPVRVSPAARERLTFWLPFAELAEGGIAEESTLSGTLLVGGVPLEYAEVCAIGATGVPKTCTPTNDLGEYALVVAPGVYRTEVRTRNGKMYTSKIDASTPGVYRNRVLLDSREGR